MTNNIINSKLISIKANVNFDALTAEASAATSEFACNAQTTLKDLGQTIDGITSLVQADFSSSEGLVNARLSLANITSAVPGLSSDLVGDVSGEASDLDLITGLLRKQVLIGIGILVTILLISLVPPPYNVFLVLIGFYVLFTTITRRL